ncbi:hypothetical protein SAMN04487886_10102 [Clostridium sp. DSM 8431]|uniref:hypothetical protein n=1 Tax=Clostridium sp. DSM 8431 TaxID=1761781 RepID=UPI0008EE75C0|nr:hypothetical protein [Clostridium sp. DSM 8431]SFU34297.1 hypothetical protein SAMN04487886_10102 [Clostridium sp. DSM 8431]
MEKNTKAKKRYLHFQRGIILFIDFIVAMQLPDHYRKNKVIFTLILICILLSVSGIILDIIKTSKGK